MDLTKIDKRYCEQDAIAAIPAVADSHVLASTERDGFGRPTNPAQPHVAASQDDLTAETVAEIRADRGVDVTDPRWKSVAAVKGVT